MFSQKQTAISSIGLGLLFSPLLSQSLSAQTPPNPVLPTPPVQPNPQLLPAPENLYQLPSGTPVVPPQAPLTIPGTITVQRFEIIGSTQFDQATLDAITTPFLGKPLTFPELLQVAEKITQLYTEAGYITSGAFIPADQVLQPQNAVIRIQVLEGQMGEIQVSGTQRLDPGYIRSRLEIATTAPFNVNRLLEALRLLQLNPLIKTITAELSSSTTPGQSTLAVTVAEADAFSADLGVSNSRSPSVGTDQRQIQLNTLNLSGLGDSVSLAFNNTDGSNGIDARYTLPISPYNTTLNFAYNTASSQVIEPPFNILKITAASRSYELGVRHPLIQTPTEELAVGLSFARKESETSLLGLRFPLSAGSNAQGQTRSSALRFLQEFTQRNSQEVFAARSQFSLGVGLFDATSNAKPPDSQFFSWRGQAQYVRLLAPETLFLVRTDIQLADRALLPLEQIGLGGQDNVRGYRQDLLLSDNGATASLEVRLPILRLPEVGGVLQLTPFFDFGTAWNTGSANPDPSTLLSGGLGLLWRQENYLTARLQWGIPFISIPANRKTWQENGLYFSIVYTPFTF